MPKVKEVTYYMCPRCHNIYKFFVNDMVSDKLLLEKSLGVYIILCKNCKQEVFN